MNKLLFTLAGLLMTAACFAQGGTIKGTVYNINNRSPLVGATVQSNNGAVAVTDKNGVFVIECRDSLVLTVSSIGYTNHQTTVKNCEGPLGIGLTPSNTELNEVEITATSASNKSILYQPVSIARLTEVELKKQTGLFLDDAINTMVPGVFMERRTASAGQQFNIRGYGNGVRGTNGVNSNFDTQGTKVYLNGIPVTDAEGITLMDDIDFGSVDNVEIVKGPSGTLYGLAIAGVVNLKTRKAEAGKISVGQDAILGSYGLERYTSHVAIGGERSSLLVNYGKQKFDGFMVHTASHKDFVNVIGDIQASDKQSFMAYFGYSDSYDERNGELTIGQYDTLDYSGNPFYIKNNAHSEVKSFRAGISHTYKFCKNFSNTSTIFGTGINSNVSSAGGWTDKQPINYGVRSTLDMKFALNDKFTLSGILGVEAQSQQATTIGYSMVKDSSNLEGYNIIGNIRSNQATTTRTASYFTEWTMAMPYEISLTAGVGMSVMDIELNDRIYVAANNTPTNPKPRKYEATYNELLSPHIAINKVFSKQLSVYASYSKGYKAPVSSYFFIPTTGEVNTGLKPEVGTQYELGTKGSLFKDKLRYQVAVFNAIFSDKMTAVAVPLNSTTTAYSYIANGGKLDNKGVEALISYEAVKSETGFFRIIKPFVNFAYSDFKYADFTFETLSSNKQDVIVNDYSGNAVAGVPPITANAGVDFVLKYGIYGNATYSYRDAMYFTSDNQNKTEAFSLVNAKVGVRQEIGKHLGIDAYFGANNITGTQYYYMVFLNQLPDAYIPAPNEINYFGGLNLKYTF